MSKWLDRARREISEKGDRHAAKRDVRILTAALAAPQPPFLQKNEALDPQVADDPILSVEQWYPEFHRYHLAVVAEASDFDYGWIRQNRPDLYRQIKNKENEIDVLETARLSEVVAIMREWRGEP